MASSPLGTSNDHHISHDAQSQTSESAPCRLTNPKPIADFIDKVKEWEERYTGRNGIFERKHFVPQKELELYWTKNKIQEVCKAHQPSITARPETIIKYFLRVFSLLVYLDRTPYLPIFVQHSVNDEQLPLSPGRVPPQLDAPPYDDLIERIRIHQWFFWPVLIEYSRLSDLNLQPEHILPFVHEEVIARGDAAEVRKVTVPGTCYGTADESNPDKTFALKLYDDEIYCNQYLNESKALSIVHAHESENIIDFFGSFVQSGTFNLLLQFAENGNFQQYLDGTEPPTTPDEIRMFWRSLFNILQGLHCVHQSIRRNSSEYRGIHQDIKPDNIVLNLGKTPSLYDFVPMLADFGHSHIRVVLPDGSDPLGIDRRGNQTYGAPECSHHSSYLQKTQNWIPSEADIFSIGCVASEAASWVAMGPAGPSKYFDFRCQATAEVPNFEDEGQAGCFHDAVGRLEAVDSFHNTIRTLCIKRSDDLTPKVLDLVEQNMLLANPKDRLSAREILEKFRKLLDEFEKANKLTRTSNARARASIAISQTTADATAGVKSLAMNIKRSVSPLKLGRHVSDNAITSTSWHSANTLLSPTSPGTQSSHSTSPRLPPRPESYLSPSSTRPRRNSSPGPDRRTAAGMPWATSDGVGQGNTSQRDGGDPVTPMSSPPPRPWVSSLPDNPYLSLEQASDWRDKWKVYDQLNPDVNLTIKTLQENIKGREYIFFIDNTTSMGQRSKEVLEAFRTLAYIAKPKESSSLKVGLAFASSTTDSDKPLMQATDVTPLAEALTNSHYNQIACFMEHKFDAFVDKVILPRLPGPPQPRGNAGGSRARIHPVSVLVLTDGRWGKSTEGAMGVENPIKKLVAEMNRRAVSRTQLTIQFVQFGDDEQGTNRLKDLVKTARDEGYDIIATTRITGNVYSIFIGSINMNHERDGEAESVVDGIDEEEGFEVGSPFSLQVDEAEEGVFTVDDDLN